MSSSDPDKQKRIEIGKSYERLAGKFFEQHGYTILERNWHSGHKEIDLIVRLDKQIIFVEVKSSRNLKFGHPAERVDKRKIGNLTDAANAYLIEHAIENCDLRFDVVTFIEGQLEHYPNAFPAPQ